MAISSSILEFRDYITTEEDCVLEQGPLKNLSRDGELRMYQTQDFGVVWTPNEIKKN